MPNYYTSSVVENCGSLCPPPPATLCPLCCLAEHVLVCLNLLLVSLEELSRCSTDISGQEWGRPRGPVALVSFLASTVILPWSSLLSWAAGWTIFGRSLKAVAVAMVTSIASLQFYISILVAMVTQLHSLQGAVLKEIITMDTLHTK